jgi:thioredoxin reductase (NADPH)
MIFMKIFDTIIVGGGAAAYAAAIYARRYNLSTVVLEGQFGGETALAGKIENYPGYDSIDGFDLIGRFKKQALGLGVLAFPENAKLAKNVYHCFTVSAGKKSYQAKTLILAMGMEHRKLGLAREEELRGKGVHYCATCDGPLYKGKQVGVVGGGDSAVKWANLLSDVGAKSVSMFVREKDLSRAEPINRKRLESKKNVAVLFGSEVVELIGAPHLKSVIVKKGNQRSEIALEGLFVAIGSVPRGDLAAELGVKLDRQNQVDVDPRTMATSVDGVFACGDLTNASGSFKQIVTGAAQGAIAATSAYLDVREHAGVCRFHARPIAGLLGRPKDCYAVISRNSSQKK